ncbi:hypothetical protein L1987_76165 [Smallanthus sonchifolius]|uniref:Uncharacterized protein n=1 Tax=Smallanthus sonchifolius TaxID=185202 RepID=A0ACB9A833_9ASTR|nr:hypothetical protein L1987_76165 [Smallanthus sonchifolius]
MVRPNRSFRPKQMDSLYVADTKNPNLSRSTAALAVRFIARRERNNGYTSFPFCAYTYVSELWRKKQSDVMRFVQRVRCWEYRQFPSVVRVTHPTRPDKARRLGYKAKQGYVIYRVRVRRGGRKRPVPKGIVYGKPTNQGVTQLKFQRSKRSVAEERAGRKLAGLKVLNSYWLNEDSTYKYFEKVQSDKSKSEILLEKIQERLNEADAKVNEFKVLFEELGELAKADINALDKATRELTQIEEDLSSADAEKRHYEGLMQQKVYNGIEISKQLKEHENERKISSEKASIICPESDIEALGGCGETTSEQLQAHLKRLKQRLQQECQRHTESIDELRMLYDKKERKIKKQRRTYKAFRDKLSAIHEALDKRWSKFQRNATLLKRQLTWQYDLPPCLLRCPKIHLAAMFVTLEGFQDAVSRKISLDTVVDFALAQGSQWIFITPHDISMVKNDERIKKQQMAAPRS